MKWFDWAWKSYFDLKTMWKLWARLPMGLKVLTWPWNCVRCHCHGYRHAWDEWDCDLGHPQEWPEANFDCDLLLGQWKKSCQFWMQVLKVDMLQDLVQMNWYHAVRRVAAGELAMEQEVSKKVEYHRNHMELHEGIDCAWTWRASTDCQGYENQRIADELLISSRRSRSMYPTSCQAWCQWSHPGCGLCLPAPLGGAGGL